jgi:hypothetical protein
VSVHFIDRAFLMTIKAGDDVVAYVYCGSRVDVDGEPASLRQLRELVGSRVTRFVATLDGSLHLRVERHEIRIPPADYEAWSIESGGRDTLGRSAPGGELIISRRVSDP